MPTETRTPRVAAVLGGNAFFLAGLAQHWISEGNRLQARTIWFMLLAFAGVSAAYVSLFGTSEKAWPLVLEIVSMSILIFCVVVGFIIIAS
jgi:hypothetical protein